MTKPLCGGDGFGTHEPQRPERCRAVFSAYWLQVTLVPAIAVVSMWWIIVS